MYHLEQSGNSTSLSHSIHSAGKLLYRFSLSIVLLFLSVAQPAHSQQLIVQADSWCPYNCQPESAEPGYAIEMLQAVFDRAGQKIKYEIVPWDRALQQAGAGMASAAVAATQMQAEKHGLLIGQESVGYSSDCLYVPVSNQREFAKESDLDSLNAVAIVSGYTYRGDFASWLARPKNKDKVLVQRGEHPAEINARNLSLGRLDGVIENSQVMSQLTYKLGLENKLRAVDCQQRTPVYIAFSPKLPNVQFMVKQFDRGIAELRQSGQLAKILAKYGQSDWK
jgi:polar amino acid transport system substrate-binding protein